MKYVIQNSNTENNVSVPSVPYLHFPSRRNHRVAGSLNKTRSLARARYAAMLFNTLPRHVRHGSGTLFPSCKQVGQTAA